MEFEQLEAEAHNLTTDNAKLAQVLRASALEEDDEDNLAAIDDSETLGTDDEQGDEDGDSEYQDEEEEEEPERQEDIHHIHLHQQLHQEQYAALHDEQAAAAAMQHLGSMQAQYPPPLPTVDYLTLSELQSPLYVEPTYHLVAPSPDVSASTSTTASAASNPPVDQAEIRRALALNLQYRVRHAHDRDGSRAISVSIGSAADPEGREAQNSLRTLRCAVCVCVCVERTGDLEAAAEEHRGGEGAQRRVSEEDQGAHRAEPEEDRTQAGQALLHGSLLCHRHGRGTSSRVATSPRPIDDHATRTWC
jgi:hypothetical protein